MKAGLKAGEFRGLEEAALLTGIDEKKKQLLELRCKVAIGDEVNVNQMKVIRAEIARMMTVLNEKKAAAGGEK